MEEVSPTENRLDRLAVGRIDAHDLVKPVVIESLGDIQDLLACAGAYINGMRVRTPTSEELLRSSDPFGMHFLGGHLDYKKRVISVNVGLKLILDHAMRHPPTDEGQKELFESMCGRLVELSKPYIPRSYKVPDFLEVIPPLQRLLHDIPTSQHENFGHAVLLPHLLRDPYCRDLFIQILKLGITHELGHLRFDDQMPKGIDINLSENELRRIERIGREVYGQFREQFRGLTPSSEFFTEDIEFMDKVARINNRYVHTVSERLPDHIRGRFLQKTRFNGHHEAVAEAFETTLIPDLVIYRRWGVYRSLYVDNPYFQLISGEQRQQLKRELGTSQTFSKNLPRALHRFAQQIRV